MINSGNNKSARYAAYQVLYDIFEKDAYANLKLQKSFKQNSLSVPDRHLATDIVYGVLRHYYSLMRLEEALAKRPIRKIHPSPRIIIAIGLFQLLHLNRIPESAAVNESVKLAKKVSHRGVSGFVNAVLRSFLRQKDSYLKKLDAWNADDPSIRWNQPHWLISKFVKDYGKDKAAAILDAFNKIPSMTVRINTLKTSREEFLSLLDDLKIEWEEVSGYPLAISIVKGADLLFNKVLPEGFCYIQSLSSMLPPLILSPDPGSLVLDMCAAPGGKTTELAALMKNKGQIAAWDLYPHKIQLIQENAKRLGASMIRAKAGDAKTLVLDNHQKADFILLDAPCSGLGVLGHKLELRFRRKEDELKEFPVIQKALLHHAASLLKDNGSLVYSTCTLNPKENEEAVLSFLQNHNDFVPVDFSLPGLGSSHQGMMTVFPDQLHSDGFFLAKLKKISQ